MEKYTKLDEKTAKIEVTTTSETLVSIDTLIENKKTLLNIIENKRVECENQIASLHEQIATVDSQIAKLNEIGIVTSEMQAVDLNNLETLPEEDLSI